MLGFGGNFCNVLNKVVVEDFVGWVFLQLCLQAAVNLNTWNTVWHARRCFTKNDENNSHSCHSASTRFEHAICRP